MRPEFSLLLLLSPVWLSAAEEPKPAAEATVQLISLAGDREDLALWDGRKATPVRLSADFFGPRLRYAGDPRLRLIQLTKPAEAAPKPAEETAPTAPPLPPGPTIAWLDLPPAAGPLRLILLVQPEPGRNGIVAMKDAEGDFPAGSIRLLNLCDFPVSLEDGRRVTPVPAKDTAVVRPSIAHGAYFDAEIFSEEDKSRRLAYHLHFFHSQERRTMIFILPVEKGTGLVRLQPIEEPPGAGTAGSPQDAKVKPPKAAR